MMLDKIKLRLHRRLGSRPKRRSDDYYDIPRIEVASELPASTGRVLSGTAADMWRLLDLTFASIRMTDPSARDAAIEQVYAKNYEAHNRGLAS